MFGRSTGAHAHGEANLLLDAVGAFSCHCCVTRLVWGLGIGLREGSLRGPLEIGRCSVNTFLQRFLAGEYQNVWGELLDLDDRIRAEPLYSDALAVARETMRRARFNIELLIPRLWNAGYYFGYQQLAVAPDFAGRQPHVFAPPHHNVQQTLAQLEALVGTLPLSLYAWYEQVGEVNFVGRAPQSWSPIRFKDEVLRRFIGPVPEEFSSAVYKHHEEHPELLGQSGVWLDPLQAISPDDQFDLYTDWKTEHDAYLSLSAAARARVGEEPGEFAIEIAPDADFKLDTGGLDAYEIAVPNRAVDGVLLNEWHNATYVQYLRTCFQWGGLPGLEMSMNPPQELQSLTEGLLPF